MNTQLAAAPIEVLKVAYPGATAWIVGSGPSLEWLSPAEFGPGPVLTINYAIQTVECMSLENPVYSMQKDQRFCDTDYPILSHAHENGKDGWGNYVFDNLALGMAWNKPSLMSCLSIAKLWGCTRCVCLCFDAVTRGNFYSYEGGKVIAKDCRGQYPLIGAMSRQWANQIGMPVEWRLVWPQRS